MCVLFLDYASWPDQKHNTRNFYHKRVKDGVDGGGSKASECGLLPKVQLRRNAGRNTPEDRVAMSIDKTFKLEPWLDLIEHHLI